jgi:uncharacterized protein YndB with AHSA1/START domain
MLEPSDRRAAMEEIRDEIVLRAPSDRVWKAIQDPGEHASWHPMVTKIAGQHALGQSRTCDVLIGKKPGLTEERCIVYEEPHRIMWSIEQDSAGFSRMVSDWKAGFSIEPQDHGATRVTAQSLFEPKGRIVRLMMPMVRRKFHHAQRAILRGLEKHVEG